MRERTTLMKLSRAHGFTLIEILVAIAIALLISAGILKVFSNASINRSELDRVNRVMENGRFAADILGDDLHQAGYYGTFAPPTATAWQDTPSPCVTSVTNPAALGWNPTTSPNQMPVAIKGWDDPAATPSDLGCLSNLVPGNDVVAIRRATSIAGSSSTDTKNLYIQLSQCSTDAQSYAVSNDVTTFTTLHNVACNATSQQISRLLVRAYYVASCNDCNPSDGIPTLKRMEMDDGVATITSLAEGVQRFEAEYGFDTNGDGVPDVWDTTINAAATPPYGWSNVVAVRLHILVRSTEVSQTLDAANRSFNLGPGHTAEQCNAGDRCRLVNTTIRLNNIAGRLETP